MASPVINQRFTATAATWVPVVVPHECSSIHLQNEDGSVNVTMRTDKDDPGTSRTIYAQQTYVFTSAQVVFAAGSTFVWVQAASGSVALSATFVR